MREFEDDDSRKDQEIDDLTVKAEEYLEIISTEDERIKIIGEELANDTGRAIFGKICSFCSRRIWNLSCGKESNYY